GQETVSYTYGWFTLAGPPPVVTNQIQSITTTLPTISAAQNGPGVADTSVIYFDQFARPIWTKDGDGFLNYTAYYLMTSAVTNSIVDVDTTKTTEFQNLPSGWSTPSGGGLNLITTYQVDNLGRPTRQVNPNGDVTYWIYNDPNHDTRIYHSPSVTTFNGWIS